MLIIGFAATWMPKGVLDNKMSNHHPMDFFFFFLTATQ